MSRFRKNMSTNRYRSLVFKELRIRNIMLNNMKNNEMDILFSNKFKMLLKVILFLLRRSMIILRVQTVL